MQAQDRESGTLVAIKLLARGSYFAASATVSVECCGWRQGVQLQICTAPRTLRSTGASTAANTFGNTLDSSLGSKTHTVLLASSLGSSSMRST